MLDVKRALASLKLPERINQRNLITPWGEELLNQDSASSPLAEYPRPTMRRDTYTMLNGPWDYAISTCGTMTSVAAVLDALKHVTPPTKPQGTILVPFSPEAALSGVNHTLTPHELLWYHKCIEVPMPATHERLILHFEAVDWACALWINGTLATTHVGGYLPFAVDATPYIASKKANAAEAVANNESQNSTTLDLMLCVYDPSNAGAQPRGKQTLNPGGMWYAAQSGIWQPVWYEVVPEVYLAHLLLQGDAQGTCQLTATIANTAPAQSSMYSASIAPSGALSGTCTISIFDAQNTLVAHTTLSLNEARLRALQSTNIVGSSAPTYTLSTSLTIPEAHLWSPDDPYLYRAEVVLSTTQTDGQPITDAVHSYCAFRTVAIQRDSAGVPRVFLNGAPYFLRGVLDQGYWPDGLMTAPSDQALEYDILSMKKLGFNMLRKHTKVERQRFYYLCDKLGMLVWQDAVIGGGPVFNTTWVSKLPTAVMATWGAFRDTSTKMHERLGATNVNYRREFIDLLDGMIELLVSHPSIITWSIFNEGYGQFDAAAVTEHVHKLDPTRPLDAVSGWFDQHTGDYLSQHNYFRPLTMEHDHGALRGYVAERGYRAFVLSECGGWAQHTHGHTLSDGVYGYGNFSTFEAWQNFVYEQLNALDALEAQGLAGYVYTQLSDVEDELNGILSYDRRVNKLISDHEIPNHEVTGN